MRDNGMCEHESLDFFKRIVPRNPYDWEGSVVLYSVFTRSFFAIAFGSGGNLDGDDMDNGFNDYIMADQYELSEPQLLDHVMLVAKNTGYVDETVNGLKPVDGGQWLLKHKDWNNGDIRRFIMEGLTFAGYGLCKEDADKMFKDIVYVGSDYDVWHVTPWNGKKKEKKGAKAK